MMSQEQESQENSSSELDSVLSQLTADQIRFIVARQEFLTDKDAAESIELKPDTVCYWKRKGAPIDQAVKLMVADGLVTALHIRKRNLAKAMAVKVAGLDSEDERLRQSVATEVCEWELGKAKQTVDQNNSGELVVRFISNVDDDKL